MGWGGGGGGAGVHPGSIDAVRKTLTLLVSPLRVDNIEGMIFLIQSGPE